MRRVMFSTSRMIPILPYAALIVFLGTPYHLIDGYIGPAYSRRYLFAGIGVLIGCILTHLFTSYSTNRANGSKRWQTLLFLGSILPILVVSLPELVSFVPYLLGDVEGSFITLPLGELPPPLSSVLPLVVWWLQLNAADPCIAIGSACATALAMKNITASEVTSDRQAPGHIDDLLTSSPSSRAALSVVRALPAIVGIFAYCSRAVWLIMTPPSLYAALPPWEFATAVTAALFAFGVLSLCIALIRYASFIASNHARDISLAGLASMGGTVCAWWAVVRFLDIPPLPLPALIAVCICTCFLGMYACLTLRKTRQLLKEPAAPASQVVTPIEVASIAAENRLREQGLAPRELEVAQLILEGLSSQKAGERLGIKASTVRATLYRVYRKLGISGEREFRAEYGERMSRTPDNNVCTPVSTTTVCTCENAASPEHETRILLSRSFMGVSALTILLLNFIPLLVRTGPWATGNVVIVGTAAVAILQAIRQAYRAYLSSLHESFDGKTCNGRMRGHNPRLSKYISASVGAGMVLLAAAWVSLCTNYLSINPYAIQGSSALSALAYAVLCLALLEAFKRCHAAAHVPEIHRVQSYVLEAAGALSFAVIAFACPTLQLPVTLSCSVFLACSLAVSFLYEPSDMHSTGPSSRRNIPPAPIDFACICHVLVGLALGCCFEELWRSITAASLASSMIPFSIMVVGFSLFIILTRRSSREFLVALGCVLALLAGGMAMGIGYQSIFIVLTASVHIGITASGERSGIHTLALAGFAAGALSAIVGVNAIQDQQLAQSEATLFVSLLGGPSSFPASIGALLACAGTIPAAAYWYLCRINFETREIERFTSSHAAPSSHERMESLLKTYGLSDVQARIMLLTALGQTAREIAQDVNYAQSTVKALRTASYKQLSITGKQDLIALLSQVDAM